MSCPEIGLHFCVNLFQDKTFEKINPKISTAPKLKQQQEDNIHASMKHILVQCRIKHTSIENIKNDENISPSSKMNCIMWNTYKGNIDLEDIENFLRVIASTTSTEYRKLLSVYDIKKFKE